jgi:hypothetical protein
MDQYDLQRIRERVNKLNKNPSTMLQAIKITRKLHIISEEEGVPYSLLIEGEVYPGCPLCRMSNDCSWNIFEGRTCSLIEYKDNKRSIERLTRWIDKIEKGE